MSSADRAQRWIDLKSPWVWLISPTATRSPRSRRSRRISVVLPEPMSPVNSENAAWGSRPDSSIVRAIACWRDGDRNAGSGVSANGLALNPKCRSYIDAPSIAGGRLGGAVQHGADEGGLVQQFDRAHEIAARGTPLGGDHETALHQWREGERIVRLEHRRQVVDDQAVRIARMQFIDDPARLRPDERLGRLHQRRAGR